MSRFLPILVLSLGIEIAALGSGSQQVLTCSGSENGDIASIAGYSSQDGAVDEMMVTFKNGEVTCYSIDPTSVYIEASFPLPGDRTLQWRHTGWFITSYKDGFTSREAVDCE